MNLPSPAQVKRSRLLRALAFVTATSLCGAAAAAETIVIGGTGSSGPLMQILADDFRNAHPRIELHIVTPPLGSGGALRALVAGRIDIAVAGRRLKAEEAAKDLAVFELARTPLVLATRDGLRPRGFSLAELADVYSGALAAWDDGRPIRLILRAPDESDTLALRAMTTEMDAAVQAAARRPGMVTAENDLDTLELIEKVPASVAPTTLGLLRTLRKDYRVLPLAGVAPSLQALESGKYPWSKSLTVIHGPRPSEAVGAFIAFLRSPGARDTMRRLDYLQVRDQR